MASSKTNGIKSRQIESIDEVLAEKSRVLSQLAEEYNEVKQKEVVVFETGNEIQIANAQYRRLLAEISVTQELEAEILPKDPDFLFERIKHDLERETESLQNTLANQDEIIEQLHKGKELLGITGHENLFEEDDSSDSENSKEEVLLKLMQSFHQKLASRLKKLLRSNFSSCLETSSNGSEISSEESSKKSLYKTLKVFFSELQSHSTFDVSERPEIRIDDSYPRDHLQLLVDWDILEVINEEPLIMSLKEP